MKKINRLYLSTFLLLFILVITAFSNIFTPHLISAGDYSTVTKEYLQDAFAKSFYSWDDSFNLGQNNTPFMNYAPYTFFIGIMGKLFQYNGVAVERIVWWIPFFALAFVSHFYMRRIVPQIGKVGFLSTFVFLFNTYTLMLLGGGQISGVGLAFGMSPLILVTFIQLPERKNLRNSLVAGLLFSLQFMFDIRIAYVTMMAVILYLFINLSKVSIKSFLSSSIYILIIPGVVMLLLHAFWLLPTIIYHQNPIEQMGEAFNSTKAVTFFSFAKFENSFALLHPNWPENIFGKVSFMKPEFLLVPLLAYCSLFFVNNQKLVTPKVKKYILFFALLGLIGSFLAKGANDPFGGVYLWMFEHFPGFFMFRDPSKWYVWIVLSYSVLIPFSVWSIYLLLNSKLKMQKYLPLAFLLFVFCYMLFLIRPVFQGQLTGAFQERSIPIEYSVFNTFLRSQPQFFRTLWIPSVQRYGLYAGNHPAVAGGEFFASSNPQDIAKKLHEPTTQKLLQDAGVEYVVLPFDSEREIFLTDRKYDARVRLQLIKELDANTWLKRKMEFGEIIVYQTPTAQNLFWQDGKKNELDIKAISPVHYQITAKEGILQGNIIFSAKYDPYWIATADDQKIPSAKFENRFNDFKLSKSVRTIDVRYVPQKWVDIGLVISGFTLLVLILNVIQRRRS